MASSFNPLIPIYADRAWDQLIPKSVSFSRDLITLEFDQDSTRAQIQPLRVFISTYCCGGDSSGICGETGSSEANLFVFIEVQRKRKGRWYTTTTSVCTCDNTFIQCVSRFQLNKCLGTYDTQIEAVDFYTALFRFQNTSASLEGSLILSLLHDQVIAEINPCRKDIGFLGIGKNILTSLLLQ